MPDSGLGAIAELKGSLRKNLPHGRGVREACSLGLRLYTFGGLCLSAAMP